MDRCTCIDPRWRLRDDFDMFIVMFIKIDYLFTSRGLYRYADGENRILLLVAQESNREE
jgi:hypothetical protein